MSGFTMFSLEVKLFTVLLLRLSAHVADVGKEKAIKLSRVGVSGHGVIRSFVKIHVKATTELSIRPQADFSRWIQKSELHNSLCISFLKR